MSVIEASAAKKYVVVLVLLIAVVAFHLVFWPLPLRNRQQDEHLVEIQQPLRVFVVDLPREFNYGLLDAGGSTDGSYPDNPAWKQYSAEYWLLGDLLSSNPVVTRVNDPSVADVVFVPFFAALSAEIQLGKSRGDFRYPRSSNEDYVRQRTVMEIVKNTSEWRYSGGRDHVFVLTDPMSMWHVREELAHGILLVVDFGGWYMEDAKQRGGAIVQHSQVSLIKDVIVPYSHLLPTLPLSEDKPRSTLLYFKGARHRHRTGLVRDKLFEILEGEAGVVLEEGFPNKTGQLEAIQGMRSAEFCLDPAGDTPTSCRLFDAVASLCIPVVVSDSVELPFEGELDYSQFAVFVSVSDALQPKVLMNRLRNMSKGNRAKMRRMLSSVQRRFEYDSGFPDGKGPAFRDGAVSMIWNKVQSKVPAVKEAIARERRRPNGAQFTSRCQCL